MLSPLQLKRPLQLRIGTVRMPLEVNTADIWLHLPCWMFPVDLKLYVRGLGSRALLASCSNENFLLLPDPDCVSIPPIVALAMLHLSISAIALFSTVDDPSLVVCWRVDLQRIRYLAA